MLLLVNTAKRQVRISFYYSQHMILRKQNKNNANVYIFLSLSFHAAFVDFGERSFIYIQY